MSRSFFTTDVGSGTAVFGPHDDASSALGMQELEAVDEAPSVDGYITNEFVK